MDDPCLQVPTAKRLSLPEFGGNLHGSSGSHLESSWFMGHVVSKCLKESVCCVIFMVMLSFKALGKGQHDRLLLPTFSFSVCLRIG